MKNVVVVFGNAGHGKDTFSDMLKEELFPYVAKTIRERSKALSESGKNMDASCAGMSISRLAYANGVKEVGKHLVGIPNEISHGTQEDKDTWNRYGKTAREWLQWIGTELGRDMVDKNIWVQRVADKINSDLFGEWFIVSDGRFYNELELYKYVNKDIKVYNIRIIRSAVPVKYTHPSETELTQMSENLFDYVVMNDRNLNYLKISAKQIAEKLIDTAKV